RLLACAPEAREPLRRLQLLISSGAPLQPKERSAIRADLCARFYEYYASTEGGGVTLCTPEDFDRHLTSVGRAIHGVEVGIVDASDGPVAVGDVGRLRYRGPGVADAFFNDPEQTQLHFRDGWFYPGDLAQQDAQGYLYLRGRSNDTVIRGGVNIYPSEVEATLMQLPRLLDCSVFGIADADLGERLACAWVGEPGLTQGELETHCRNLLTRYKLPSVWLRLDELPRNSAGKVLKSRLMEMVESP
ncbi:MAG: fatty acid--CoA ligase family protein, partial [Burkholderiaceae bacterium]